MTEIRKNIAIQSFQKKQNQYKVIVIAGNDRGQVQIITKLAQEAFLGQKKQNKMASKYLNAAQWDEYDNALIDCSRSPSMFAGKFVIKINEVKHKLTQIIKKYLENPNPDCLIIIQTNYLTLANSLRKIASANNDKIAYIPCYDNDLRDNLQIIKDTVAKNGKNIEHDAALIMAKHLGADQILTNIEIDKLLLFCQNEKIIQIKHVEQTITDNSLLQSEILCDMIMNAEAKTAVEKFEKLIYSGVNENYILALFIKHVIMMQRIVLQIEDGHNIQKIINSYRPMIFFRRKTAIKQQCKIWKSQDIAIIMHEVVRAHADIRTGAQKPFDVTCRFIITAIKIAQKTTDEYYNKRRI